MRLPRRCSSASSRARRVLHQPGTGGIAERQGLRDLLAAVVGVIAGIRQRTLQLMCRKTLLELGSTAARVEAFEDASRRACSVTDALGASQTASVRRQAVQSPRG